MKIDPARVTLEDGLIKVTDAMGQDYWYQPTEQGQLEEGTPVSIVYGRYTLYLFVPRVAGIPLLIPTIRKVEDHGHD